MRFSVNDARSNRFIRAFRRLGEDSEGVVLAAVLIFISLLLPVTLVILNSVEIETMLPTNEGFGKIASHEADKGFDMVMAALMADNQDGVIGDAIVDPTRPIPASFPMTIASTDTYLVMGMAHGRHDIDYLAEPWARHPENYTYFLSEHSRENTVHPTWNPDPDYEPDEYSIPTRWIMMNVPFGMDDHGELTVGENDYPDQLTNMENRSGANLVTPVNAFAADTTDPDDEWQSPPIYVHEDWRISPSHPDFRPPKYVARPASYFRNTNPGYAASNPIFDNVIADALVYDSSHDDADGDGIVDIPTQTQYLPNPELQEAVSDSTWSNVHYGSGAQSAKNREYKPLPGCVTQYPVGSTGEDFIPAWFESICSDESSRFNLNTILNVVFQGANYDYNSENDSLENPLIKYDSFEDIADFMDFIYDTDHPNYSNHYLAIDMLASLLMEDEDLTSIMRYNQARIKAYWILRNMLLVRARLDANYDADGDGVPDEIDLTFPDPGTTTDKPDEVMNGRGRMGDGLHPWLGTWQVYKNPKDFLNDPGPFGYDDPTQFRPITDEDFKILHNACSVYTYDTEYIADQEFSGADDDVGYRMNFNTVDENSFYSNHLLGQIIKKERAASLIRWRDGLVDLNGDGDLNDEFILQPVKDPGTAEADTNVRYTNPDNQPVSEITYRERNHYNFQNPADPEYPSMLNVPDLGSLLLVPMSVRQTQIVASVIDPFGANPVNLSKFDPALIGPGAMIPNTDAGDDPYVSDIDFTGTQVIFDEISAPLEEFGTVDVPRGDFYNFPAVSAEGYHPSLNSDATQFVYVDKDTTVPSGRTISTWDILNDARLYTNLNGGVPLAQIINLPGALQGDFLEPASPDWSPVANLIAFSGGGTLDGANIGTGRINIYTVRVSGPGVGIPDNITNCRPGQYALYPDFSPDGNWLAYTFIDVGNAVPFKIRLQNLVNNQRRDIPTPGTVPIAPDWDPYGNNLCFMGTALAGDPDIFTVSRSGSNIRNITQTPGVAEMFPCWGWGTTVLAAQGDKDGGQNYGQPIPYPPGGVNPDGDPWDATYRQELANVIQNASTALRRDIDDGAPQNWRYMDLPVVPQHTVDALRMVADLYCFRPPYYAPPNTPASSRMPYAYPPRVNINTAPRKVLRSLFLLMFQGSVMEFDSTQSLHGSAPLIEDTSSNDLTPLNLCYRGLIPEERLLAIALADTYAHQVDEYRRWVYNNQSRSFSLSAYDSGSHTFSVTPETVPDELIYPLADKEINEMLNYRANPFSPYDTDLNLTTQERPMYDPVPPFRNIADLFNITLYDGEWDQPWLLEGFDNTYGPDPEEQVNWGNANHFVVPTAFEDGDSSTEYNNWGDAISGPNAIAVWGPIYQTEYINITQGLAIGDEYELPAWKTGDGNVEKNPQSWYYKQQRFRLFSADDFKWISPYLTTRSYLYRVESRGIVRVANGTNKLDISRDKFWVVDFGRAYLNHNTTSWETNPAEPINARQAINGGVNQPYVVRAFEEVPVDGISLTRRFFTPPPM